MHVHSFPISIGDVANKREVGGSRGMVIEFMTLLQLVFGDKVMYICYCF